jgi:hypothetical protein
MRRRGEIRKLGEKPVSVTGWRRNVWATYIHILIWWWWKWVDPVAAKSVTVNSFQLYRQRRNFLVRKSRRSEKPHAKYSYAQCILLCTILFHCSRTAPYLIPSQMPFTICPCSKCMLHPDTRISSLKTMNYEHHNRFISILNQPSRNHKRDCTKLALTQSTSNQMNKHFPWHLSRFFL